MTFPASTSGSFYSVAFINICRTKQTIKVLLKPIAPRVTLALPSNYCLLSNSLVIFECMYVFIQVFELHKQGFSYKASLLRMCQYCCCGAPPWAVSGLQLEWSRDRGRAMCQLYTGRTHTASGDRRYPIHQLGMRKVFATDEICSYYCTR